MLTIDNLPAHPRELLFVIGLSGGAPSAQGLPQPTPPSASATAWSRSANGLRRIPHSASISTAMSPGRRSSEVAASALLKA